MTEEGAPRCEIASGHRFYASSFVASLFPIHSLSEPGPSAQYTFYAVLDIPSRIIESAAFLLRCTGLQAHPAFRARACHQLCRAPGICSALHVFHQLRHSRLAYVPHPHTVPHQRRDLLRRTAQSRSTLHARVIFQHTILALTVAFALES